MGVIDGNQGTASPGHPNDAQWAIYFFSYGKFTQTCQQVAANTQVINPVGVDGCPDSGHVHRPGTAARRHAVRIDRRYLR